MPPFAGMLPEAGCRHRFRKLLPVDVIAGLRASWPALPEKIRHGPGGKIVYRSAHRNQVSFSIDQGTVQRRTRAVGRRSGRVRIGQAPEPVYGRCQRAVEIRPFFPKRHGIRNGPQIRQTAQKGGFLMELPPDHEGLDGEGPVRIKHRNPPAGAVAVKVGLGVLQGRHHTFPQLPGRTPPIGRSSRQIGMREQAGKHRRNFLERLAAFCNGQIAVERVDPFSGQGNAPDGTDGHR